MISGSINNILHAGLSGITKPLEFRRVLLVNNLSFFSVVICWLLSFLLFLQDIYPSYLITLLGGSLFILIISLNKFGKYKIATNLYLFLSVVIVYSASLIAFRQGRDNEVENIIIGFMASSFFFYDGKRRTVIFLILFMLLISLKVLRNYIMLIPFDINFWLNIQITFALSLIIFLFSRAIRKSLMVAFDKMKQQDEILYSMIDNVPILIGMLDVRGNYKMVNDSYEKMFGLKRNEIIGNKMEDVLPANIFQVQAPLFEKAIAGVSVDFLHELELPNGKTISATGTYEPIFNEKKEISSVSVFLNDVTRLEDAKKELKNANKTKDQLFSIIAHDIRSPLNLFESVLSFTKEETLNKEQFFKYQSVVKEKLNNLRKTLDILLDWAKSQMDGINASPSDVNLKVLIEESVQIYQPLLNKKEIDFQLQVKNNYHAWIDENHLKVIVRNLVHNAIKFTPKNGSITISSTEFESFNALKISDSGVGISQEKIKSILSKELQKSQAGTQGEGGTGMGLSLSFGLLEKNDCKVKILSKPSEGTTFEIKIPRKINKEVTTIESNA